MALIKHCLMLAIVALLFIVGCHSQMTPEEMANMKKPDLANDHCAQYNKSCYECASVKGCNYCQKSNGPSFCTSIDNAEKASCVVPGCSADTFIQSLAMCSGGCNSGYSCEDCANTPGCGWCHNKGDGNTGCMEAVDFVNAALRCQEPGSVWTLGYLNCSAICERRYGRDSCMKPDRACIWNGTDDTCSTSPTGIAQEIIPPTQPSTPAPTKAPAAHKINPPTPEWSENQRSHSNTAMMFVLVIGVAVGVLMYKKLR